MLPSMTKHVALTRLAQNRKGLPVPGVVYSSTPSLVTPILMMTCRLQHQDGDDIPAAPSHEVKFSIFGPFAYCEVLTRLACAVVCHQHPMPRSNRGLNVTAPLRFTDCDLLSADDIAALAIQRPGPGFAGWKGEKSAIATVGVMSLPIDARSRLLYQY